MKKRSMREREFLPNGQTRIPGIYGGMGPAAHILFEEKLLAESTRRGASADQEHPYYVLVSGSSTPDRTRSLQGGPSAVNHLVHTAQRLERAGADFIVMTCNTAHAYRGEMQAGVEIPIISMIDETAAHIQRTSTTDTRVGVMATSGTIQTGLYQDALTARKIATVSPGLNSQTQRDVMDAIYNRDHGIKATGTVVSDRAREQLLGALDWYEEQGADTVILGCTELSVGLRQGDTQLQLIDPLQVLAERTLDEAFAK